MQQAVKEALRQVQLVVLQHAAILDQIMSAVN
jgi:hypothetical protein